MTLELSKFGQKLVKTQKLVQNRSKNGPKWIQNGSKLVPKLLKLVNDLSKSVKLVKIGQNGQNWSELV